MSDSKGAAIDEAIDNMFALPNGTPKEVVFVNGIHPEGKIFHMPYSTFKQAILALLAQEVKRVIGENEKEIGNHGKNEHITIPARNNLRAEMRERAGL